MCHGHIRAACCFCYKQLLLHTNINSHDRQYLIMIIKVLGQGGGVYVAASIRTKIYTSQKQNKLVSVRIPSDFFLCIPRFHGRSRKNKGLLRYRDREPYQEVICASKGRYIKFIHLSQWECQCCGFHVMRDREREREISPSNSACLAHRLLRHCLRKYPL